MKQDINLNAELREWFGMQMSALLKDNPQDIRKHYLDLDEAKKDLIQIVYDRVITLPDSAKQTADYFCISRKTVYNYTKK